MLFTGTRKDDNFEKKYECSNSFGHYANSAPRSPQALTSWKVIYETHLEEQFYSQMEHIKMKTLP